jgi:hypothetical protein
MNLRRTNALWTFSLVATGLAQASWARRFGGNIEIWPALTAIGGYIAMILGLLTRKTWAWAMLTLDTLNLLIVASIAPFYWVYFVQDSRVPYSLALVTAMCLVLGRRSFNVRRRHLSSIFGAILVLPLVVYVTYATFPHGVSDYGPPWPAYWYVILLDSGLMPNGLLLSSWALWFIAMGLAALA